LPCDDYALSASSHISYLIRELASISHVTDEISARRALSVSFVAHAGDVNLHPTVEAADTPECHAAAEVDIGDITRLALELGGTISGEHGIGLVKQAELP